MIRFPLGIRLMENGIIDEVQLNEALELQKQKSQQGTRIRLGEALVELGFCSVEDIAKAMSQNTGYEMVSLNRQPIDMNAANLLSPEIVQRYAALPVGFEGRRLRVAMHDPNNLMAIDDIALITGREVVPVVVSDDELHAVIEQYTNVRSAIEAEMDEEGDEPELSEMELAGTDKPAVMLVNHVISSAVRSGASDIHIEPQEKHLRIRYRIDGVLHEVMSQPLGLHATTVSRIKVMAGMDIAERRIPQDGRTTVRVENKVIDIRVATLPSAYGEKATLRLLNRSAQMITIDKLGFPDRDRGDFMDTIRLPYGFVLVTGPTGSGKSTTLYAVLAELNSSDKNIITLEDPIERRMDGLNQIPMNFKAGMTFASGLRSVLRNDPDIVMIGEIRDRDTAKIALEAALTGHLVLSTLHTNDAASAITRLNEMGAERFLIASALAGVVAQRLVRVLCPSCKREYQVKREELLRNIPDFPLDEQEETVRLYKAIGCLSCNNTGYRSRAGIYEFLRATDEVQNIILSGGSNHEIRQKAIEQGMTTLRRDGFDKVRRGITSLEELLRVVV